MMTESRQQQIRRAALFLWVVGAVLMLPAHSIFAGEVESESSGSGGQRQGREERKVLYWVAPMDPSFRADKAGKSPMGMDLVPVYADDGHSDHLVKIDPVVVQNMGVRIAVVRRGLLKRSIRTVGEVLPAEDALSVVNLRFSGWIERIYADETGVEVKKGSALLDIYSPELVSAQDEFLVALRSGGAKSGLARSAKRRLELLGLRSWQIEKLVTTGESRPVLTITAPQDGYILHKSVVQGGYVKSGVDLYRIADLSKVWVEAEVYEADAAFVALGAGAKIALTFQPGTILEGKVSYIYPTLNPRTRTLRVRIELDNPEMRLKLDSFATVSIASAAAEATLLIPTEAVIHSGMRSLVFVAQALGRYEAREVVVGHSGENYVSSVLSGLQEGERIVTSGQFLLDSESQLQESVQKMLEARLHASSPEAGVKSVEKVEAGGAAPKGVGAEKESQKTKGYWTCGMHPQIVEEEPGSCPICAMDLVHKDHD